MNPPLPSHRHAGTDFRLVLALGLVEEQEVGVILDGVYLVRGGVVLTQELRLRYLLVLHLARGHVGGNHPHERLFGKDLID